MLLGKRGLGFWPTKSPHSRTQDPNESGRSKPGQTFQLDFHDFMLCSTPPMSPTVLRYKGFRFFFFSREESRMHVHVSSAEGEAKFWLEPIIALANNYRFSAKQLKEIQKIIEEQNSEITNAWKKHFKS